MSMTCVCVRHYHEYFIQNTHDNDNLSTFWQAFRQPDTNQHTRWYLQSEGEPWFCWHTKLIWHLFSPKHTWQLAVFALSKLLSWLGHIPRQTTRNKTNFRHRIDRKIEKLCDQLLILSHIVHICWLPLKPRLSQDQRYTATATCTAEFSRVFTASSDEETSPPSSSPFLGVASI